MATILPTTPIEMPDLASQAFKLQEYRTEQKKEAAKEARDQQDKRRASIGLEKAYSEGAAIGRLMPPYIPETQKAFQEFIKAGEQYSYSGLDSDKQAYLESLNNYNALFGSALEKSESDKSQFNGFSKSPSDYAMTGQDYTNFTQNYLNSKLSREQILNPMERVVLPAAEKLKFMQPQELANAGTNVILGSKKMDFSDGYSMNRDAAKTWLTNTYVPSMIIPGSDAELQAIIYGAKKNGWNGLDTRENLSASDLETLKSLAQDQKDVFKSEYVNDAVRLAMTQIPSRLDIKEPKGGNKTVREERLATLKFNPQDIQQTVTKGGSSKKTTLQENVNMYILPSDMWINTDRGESITRFGVGGNGRVWVKKSKVDPTTKEVIDLGIKEATKDEKNYLRAELGSFYDVYLSEKDPGGVL
jgi:hypothetical protein